MASSSEINKALISPTGTTCHAIKAFNVAEICERILLLVDPEDIFRTNRVYRQLRSVFLGSRKLLTKCFYIPTTPTSTWLIDAKTFTITPMLGPFLPPPTVSPTPFPYSGHNWLPRRIQLPLLPNPLVIRHVPYNAARDFYDIVFDHHPPEYRFETNTYLRFSPLGIDLSNAWTTDMYFSSPPTRDVEVVFWMHILREGAQWEEQRERIVALWGRCGCDGEVQRVRSVEVRVRNERGLTVGDIVRRLFVDVVPELAGRLVGVEVGAGIRFLDGIVAREEYIERVNGVSLCQAPKPPNDWFDDDDHLFSHGEDEWKGESVPEDTMFERGWKARLEDRQRLEAMRREEEEGNELGKV